MTFDADLESSVFLFGGNLFPRGSVLHFMVLASALVGRRPLNIGLHNDAYLSKGQHAIEVSRLHSDGRPGTGVTWLGIYGHSTDVYGDRGNYCGIGVWHAGGVAAADVERHCARCRR